MLNISLLCDEILKHLTAMGRKIASSMLPGLSEIRVRQLTASLPFELPDSAIQLYQWSEGLRPKSGLGNELFPGYSMISLPEMIAMYNELGNALEFPRFRSDSMQWFPIFRSGGTDFFGICCQETPTEDAPIVDDDNEGEHRDGVTLPRIEFINLEAMLRTILHAYETGVYYVDEQGQLEVGVCTYNKEGQLVDVDISKFKELARQFNPGVKRWE